MIPKSPNTPDASVPFDLIDISRDLGVAAQSGTAKSILVAGQALAFWGAYYLDEHAPAEYDIALASRDIDFFERRIERVREYIDAMKSVVETYGAQMSDPLYPTLDDSTFQTAILELNHPSLSQPIIIDFLGSVDGLTDQEVECGADTINVNGKSLPILNPVLCLKARIHNLLVLYPRLGKSDDRMAVELLRVKAAIEIVRAYLIDLRQHNPKDGARKAHQRIRPLLKLARKNSLGRELYRRYAVNVLDAFEGAGFPDRFMTTTVADLRQKIETP